MRLVFAFLLTTTIAASLYSQQTKPAAEKFVTPPRPVHTFSIVARDPATGELGVAVQSHWFSVGAIVPWAEAGVGAVATQSFVDPSYGKLGLDLMRTGKSGPDALAVFARGRRRPRSATGGDDRCAGTRDAWTGKNDIPPPGISLARIFRCRRI